MCRASQFANESAKLAALFFQRKKSANNKNDNIGKTLTKEECSRHQQCRNEYLWKLAGDRSEWVKVHNSPADTLPRRWRRGRIARWILDNRRGRCRMYNRAMRHRRYPHHNVLIMKAFALASRTEVIAATGRASIPNTSTFTATLATPGATRRRRRRRRRSLWCMMSANVITVCVGRVRIFLLLKMSTCMVNPWMLKLGC